MLTVREPPRRWGAIKPALLVALRTLRARRVRPPGLAGVPLCALGAEHGELPEPPSEPRFPHPAECAACARRDACSPPAAWGEDLAPFGPTDPLEQWRRVAPALEGATGVDRGSALDAVVARMADPRLGAPITLEPSIGFEPAGVRPALRLAVFHGRLPDDRRAAHAATRAQLDAFTHAHVEVGAPVPEALLALLVAAAPVPVPLGFELAQGELRLKAYARVHAKAPAARAKLLADLVRLAVVEGCSSVAVSVPPAELGMIGVTTAGGRIVEVKAYVEARPTAGATSLGLPAIAADHLLVRLSRDRAHAVVDVAATRPRPPKWDFRLRDALLPGQLAGPVFGAWAGARARSVLDGLASRANVRLDAVAASVRGDEAVLYFDVG